MSRLGMTRLGFPCTHITHFRLQRVVCSIWSTLGKAGGFVQACEKARHKAGESRAYRIAARAFRNIVDVPSNGQNSRIKND